MRNTKHLVKYEWKKKKGSKKVLIILDMCITCEFGKWSWFNKIKYHQKKKVSLPNRLIDERNKW